jgi:hypothetical protein
MARGSEDEVDVRSSLYVGVASRPIVTGEPVAAARCRTLGAIEYGEPEFGTAEYGMAE